MNRPAPSPQQEKKKIEPLGMKIETNGVLHGQELYLMQNKINEIAEALNNLLNQ